MNSYKPKAFIFGAGKRGSDYFQFIKENYDILGYLDNNVKLHNNKLNDVEIFPPNIVKKVEFDFIIITRDIDSFNAIKSYNEMIKQLLSFSVKKSKIINLAKIPKPFRYHRIAIILTQHCNLNCAYCVSFSPLAEKKFLDLKSLEKDLKQLSKLTNGHVMEICFSGVGEPLLHPEVIQAIDLIRKYFNEKTRIALQTNGILLAKQPKEFWECAKRNGLFINISYYPIKLNINEIKNLSIQYLVPIQYDSLPTRNMTKFILDLKGLNKTKYFDICHQGNACLCLIDGLLYTCATAAFSEHFFNKFGFLEKSVKDSINIHKVKSEEELVDFVSKPIPFCRFCKGREDNLEWKPSKKEISEWT